MPLARVKKKQYLCGVKRIQYMMPVEWVRGNISGRQVLAYGSDSEKAYSLPDGSITAANDYRPRLIAKVRARDRLKYFSVRTRSSVNMSASMRRNMALLGGCGAILAAIMRDHTGELYISCVRVLAEYETLRAALSPVIRQMLSDKEDSADFRGVLIDNPWIKSAANVQVPAEIIEKFASILSNL